MIADLTMNFFSDVLSYPVRKSGKYILVMGTIISLLADLASIAPLIGGIASWLFFGYFCAIYFQIIQSSAIGGEEAPEFPESTDFMDDLIWPILQTLFVLLVSFGPLIGYAVYAPENPNGWIVLGLLTFGAFYAPMAIMAIAVLGYVGAISPHIVFPAIFRAGWLYPAAVGLIVLLYGLVQTGQRFVGHGILAGLLLEVAAMYCLMANGRALGLIYRKREKELNWL